MLSGTAPFSTLWFLGPYEFPMQTYDLICILRPEVQQFIFKQYCHQAGIPLEGHSRIL